MKKKIIYIILAIITVAILVRCSSGNRLEDFTIEVNSEIPVNESAEIKVSYKPFDVEEEISWSSDNEKIAIVKDGKVYGKSIGVTVLTFTASSGLKKYVKIEVYQKAKEIALNKDSLEMFISEKFQLTSSVSPEDAKYKEVNWSSENESIAIVKNGLVEAIAPGETIVKAFTKDGTFKTCKVIVKEKDIIFSGSGDKIISNLNIPSGNFKAIFTNNGKSNFVVKLYSSPDDGYGNLLVNEIGKYTGSVLAKDGETSAITNGILEIKSSGSWTVKFERLTGNINGKSVSGTGDTVTGWFDGDSKRKTINFNNSGSSNFIVKIYNEAGNSELLVNEIGSYSGQTTFLTDSNEKYYFEVKSSGTWSINW